MRGHVGEVGIGKKVSVSVSVKILVSSFSAERMYKILSVFTLLGRFS